jgi:hypothetical protein
MTSPFLSEAYGVVALPAFPFTLQKRPSEGVLWDQERQEIVVEAMPAISTPPQRQEIVIEAGELTEAALRSLADAAVATVEEPAIYGGSLLRHFGHFCHESLGRLWWLSREDATPAPAQAARSRLQQQNANVYFFMPTWLDCGKDLLPYMAEILAGLGLRSDRIRILDRPIRFQHLLIPVQSWGFLWDREAWNAYLGCDSRALMRSLLTSFRVPADPQGEAAPTRLYVSRSGLPLNLGRLIGDSGLDHLMAAAGYTIFHPERHDIATQIRFYSQASDIVFMDGSSLYLLWFARLQPGARISVILRRRQGHGVCARLHELLPDADRIHWRLLDELLGEELTSDKDWESHNLADFAALARQLAPAVPFPCEEVKRGLDAYAQELVRDSSQEQVIGIVRGLLSELLLKDRRQPTTRERVVAAVRHRLRRLRRRLTSL